MNVPMSGRVVVVGSINLDLVAFVPRLPTAGETVLAERFERHFGGKGANQAVAAARAGATVEMVGAVGRDADGDACLEALAGEGVDVARVARVDAPTGVALIAVDPAGENQIVVVPGANDAVSADAVSGLAAGRGVLLASLEVPISVVVAAVTAARGLELDPVVNPAPARPLPPDLLRAAPILLPNEGEASTLAGVNAVGDAITHLRTMGVGQLVVTRGAAGITVLDGGRREDVPAIATDLAVDTTGAGDTFAGVFAAWLAGGATLLEAARAGNAAASLSVRSAGARSGMPRRAEIEAALRLA